jgi:hypothetical protein
VKSLNASGSDQNIIRFDVSTEFSMQSSWWSFRSSGRTMTAPSYILMMDNITSEARRCLNEMNWIRKVLRSRKNNLLEAQVALRHKVSRWLFDMANFLLFSNICVLCTCYARHSFELSTVPTTPTSFPTIFFEIRALDVRERIAALSSFLQAEKVGFFSLLVVNIVSFKSEP